MNNNQTRIDSCFAKCRDENRAALVTFMTAGDPDYQTSCDILNLMANSGADIIELGMPFSDPMADGPAIQLANQRALNAGQTLKKTLAMVEEFRAQNQHTPIILMGYYNPIYRYGSEAFVKKARDVGVDGLIVVDLPPEADNELCLPAIDAGLNFIRLATPTTDNKRLPKVLNNTSGFVYYVSITGITGAATPDIEAVKENVARIKKSTTLPIAVGFGVKTGHQARDIARGADGVVVGSAIVSLIEKHGQQQDRGNQALVDDIQALISELREGISAAQSA